MDNEYSLPTAQELEEAYIETQFQKLKDIIPKLNNIQLSEIEFMCWAIRMDKAAEESFS